MNHMEFEQLQLKNKIFQRILDEIDVGVHVVNEEGRTTYYNKKMAQIEGMDYEDVLDKNLLDVFSFNQDEDSTLLQALKNGSKIKNAKQTYFNNKGQEITTINNTFPIMEDGEQIGAMEIARDVTKLEKLIRENMNKRGDTRYTFDSIIGSSDEIHEVIEASKEQPGQVLLS